MTQMSLSLTVAASGELDGVEMGILGDGVGYLSQRGLARMCGVDNRAIGLQSEAWEAGERDSKLAKLIVAHGYAEPSLFRRIMIDGVEVYAYPERVCIAFLEYYAFDARERDRTAQALRAYRSIGRFGMHEFICQAVGYVPAAPQPLPPPVQWRPYLERIDLNTEPAGYFTVFGQTQDFVVSLIREGLQVDSRTIPDISIGQFWGPYWKQNNLEGRFGTRERHGHAYPPDHPQAQADIEPWAYPLAALGEFRLWLQNFYIPQKLEPYLKTKVKQNLLSVGSVRQIVAAVTPKALGSGPTAPALKPKPPSPGPSATP